MYFSHFFCGHLPCVTAGVLYPNPLGSGTFLPSILPFQLGSGLVGDFAAAAAAALRCQSLCLSLSAALGHTALTRLVFVFWFWLFVFFLFCFCFGRHDFSV